LRTVLDFPRPEPRRAAVMPGSEKTDSSATTSAKPSWNAAWSGDDGSVKC